MIERLFKSDFESIYEIMEQSFPKEEYRTKQKQKELFNVKEYNVLGEKKDGKLLGFITVWDFEEFYYVEHFAIAKQNRNLGLGSKMLQEIKEIYTLNKPFILEVEPPEDELTKRRVAFYQRNGYKYNDYYYVQPSMAKGRREIPLKILSSPNSITEEQFKMARDTLYKKVYKIIK